MIPTTAGTYYLGVSDVFGNSTGRFALKHWHISGSSVGDRTGSDCPHNIGSPETCRLMPADASTGVQGKLPNSPRQAYGSHETHETDVYDVYIPQGLNATVCVAREGGENQMMLLTSPHFSLQYGTGTICGSFTLPGTSAGKFQVTVWAENSTKDDTQNTEYIHNSFDLRGWCCAERNWRPREPRYRHRPPISPLFHCLVSLAYHSL